MWVQAGGLSVEPQGAEHGGGVPVAHWSVIVGAHGARVARQID